MDSLNVALEFGGGLELLVGNVKEHRVSIPIQKSAEQQPGLSVKQVVAWIKENMLKDRPEMFVTGENVRPGILVLINDADWELCGGAAYKVQEGDQLTFISTLHGG